MKQLFLAFLASLAILIPNVPTAQDEIIDADTLLISENADGTFTLIAGKVFRGVSKNVKDEKRLARVQKRSNNLAQLEVLVKAAKQQVSKDSLQLIAELKGEGIQIGDLFKDSILIAKFEGEWVLRIGKAKDNLTISADGTFTSKKSGPGKLVIVAEGAKKIILELAGKKIPLFKESEKLFENKELDISFKRNEEDKKR